MPSFKTGEYQNASEAIRDALGMLQQNRRQNTPKLKPLQAQSGEASTRSNEAISPRSLERFWMTILKV
jgi:Arc/MetJ-type ribon-helix-helix transcriptional regulator